MVNQINLDVYLRHKPHYLRKSGLDYTRNRDHFEYLLHWNRGLYPYLTIIEHLHPAMRCCNRQDSGGDDIVDNIVKERNVNFYWRGGGKKRKNDWEDYRTPTGWISYPRSKNGIMQSYETPDGTYNVHLSSFSNESCDESEVRDILKYMATMSLILATKYSGVLYDPKHNIALEPRGVKLSVLEEEIYRTLNNGR